MTNLYLSMIYRTEMERITIVSLNQALKNQSFTQEQKIYLRKKLSDILLFDTKIFFDALESDRRGIIRLLKSEKAFQSEFGKKVITQVDILIQEHNEEYHALKTEQDLKEFDKKFSETKKWFSEKYEQLEHKKLSYDKRIYLESGLIAFEAARCIRNTKIGLWKSIESNKKLLETLN